MALTLPILTVWHVEHRQKAAIAEIFAAGAGVTPEHAAPWLKPAFAVLGRAGISVGNRPCLTKYTMISFWGKERGGHLVTSEEMRRIVSAANQLGTVWEVEFMFSWPSEEWEADALVPLRDLKTLTSLDFQYCPTDAALEAASRISQIREINLVVCCGHDEVTGEGYAALANLPHLERLHVEDCTTPSEKYPPPPAEEFASISHIAGLRTLIFRGHHVSAAGLRHLASLPCLERLALFNTIPQAYFKNGTFERDYIPALASMPALKELRIRNKRGMSKEQIAELKAALPGVVVTECHTYGVWNDLPSW